MGAGMWKRSLTETHQANAVFKTDISSGNLPLTVNFDASASLPSGVGSSIVSYNWDFGDGKTATGEKTSHVYMQKKAFAVKLTVTDDKGNSGYAYKTIDGFIYGPVADFVASTYTGKTGHEIQFFGELSFDENPDDSIVSYQWDFKDRGTASGKNVSHTFTDYGVFNVKLTVKNRANQTSSVTKSVNIVLNTAIKQAENSNSFRVYPNPVNDKLTVEWNGKAEISVCNSLGQIIISEKDAVNSIEINTQHWQTGIYLLSVQHGNSIVFRKIVKQ
jgi:PKD repeat protein